MVAGEASGDLLASLLLRGLRSRWPGLNASGIGGPRMAEQGFESWWSHERLSVFGYVDALGRLPELLRIRRQLAERLLSQRPAVFIGVDAPDFNFGLETRLRQAGIKTVHFVCPSIWAWRGERVKKLAKAVDHVLCLFPFEPALLQRHGIAASYVGHPLADAIPLEPPRAASRESLGLAPDSTVIALLPGSRRSEIVHIAPRILAAAALMHRQRPGLEFVLPVAPRWRALLEPLLAKYAPGVPIRLLDGQSPKETPGRCPVSLTPSAGLEPRHQVCERGLGRPEGPAPVALGLARSGRLGDAHQALAACDVSLIASGTATLEAALFKRPMVITYRVAWLDWLRMRRMNYLPWIGLPNILSGEFVVPELIQDAATPQALARETLAWLDNPAGVDALRRRFDDLHHQLRQDTAQKASDAIAQVIQA